MSKASASQAKPAKRKPSLPALGRGLASLQSLLPRTERASLSPAGQTPAQAPALVPLVWLEPDPNQPRQDFSQSEIAELAASIAEKGLLQPILARGLKSSGADPRYRIIAGERRFRAAQKAGLTRVPVLIRQTSPEEALELALVENLQRQDLNPVEEARALARLARKFGYKPAEIGAAIGKSRAYVANALRLLGLSDAILAMLAQGQISSGHARALLALPAAMRGTWARKIVERGLTVRQLENLASARKPVLAKQSPKDANLASMARELEQKLGVRVEITSQKGEKWQLRLAGSKLAQFDALTAKLLA